jgi:hypothetical protein
MLASWGRGGDTAVALRLFGERLNTSVASEAQPAPNRAARSELDTGVPENLWSRGESSACSKRERV